MRPRPHPIASLRGLRRCSRETTSLPTHDHEQPVVVRTFSRQRWSRDARDLTPPYPPLIRKAWTTSGHGAGGFCATRRNTCSSHRLPLWWLTCGGECRGLIRLCGADFSTDRLATRSKHSIYCPSDHLRPHRGRGSCKNSSILAQRPFSANDRLSRVADIPHHWPFTEVRLSQGWVASGVPIRTARWADSVIVQRSSSARFRRAPPLHIPLWSMKGLPQAAP